MNESGRLIKRYAGRKGGLRQVKKGFAKMNPERLRQIGYETARKRWGYDSNSRADTQQEERKADN